MSRVPKALRGPKALHGPTGPAGSLGTAVLDDLNDTVITSPATGQVLRYNGTNWVNAATTNITTLGTIVTGVWNGTLIGSTYGGTGVNNGSNTITLGGNLVTSGAFATTLTATGTTSVTLPTTGTLSTLDAFNKYINNRCKNFLGFYK